MGRSAASHALSEISEIRGQVFFSMRTEIIPLLLCPVANEPIGNYSR